MSETSEKTWTLTARWIIPVDGPPLKQGTITLSGDRIVAVEPQGERSADQNLENVAILPGFVNAHTHLDLSGVRGKCPPTPDFTEWLRGVIRHRRTQTPEQIECDIREGLCESLANGTTLLGDITAGGASWSILSQAPIRSVVFHELLGLPWARVPQVADVAAAWLRAHQESANCRPGLSPHAPYSTHQALYDGAAKLAAAFRVPLATHLAETKAELELLEHHSGPLVDFLIELGVWNPTGLVGKPSEVISLCRPCRQMNPLLYIHCNYLPVSVFFPREATMVYCPRTHAAFGHPPHPFREFLARGIRVALGTDSLASNPDLSVLEEARFVHQRHPDVAGDTLLRMATLSGAEALGWQDETGSLTPGKSADLVVLPLPNVDPPNPHALVLESSLPVKAVLFRGQWVFGNP